MAPAVAVPDTSGPMADLLSVFGLGTGDVEAAALLVGLIGGVLGYFLVSRRAAKQALRVERSQAYMQLEIASIDTFRYRAEHAYAIHWSLTGKNPRRLPTAILREYVDQYYYQCLNLFEVASRFRKARIIEPEIYASWIAWFFEALEVPYFREQWGLEYKDNYTQELQQIFDGGIALWEKANLAPITDPDALGRAGEPGDATDNLRRAFYKHVGFVVPCAVISGWLDEAEPHSWLANVKAKAYRRMHGLKPLPETQRPASNS